MSIKRINEFPEGSGSLSNDDVFLFMDDPSGSSVTKKISLSEISAAIGGGGGGGNSFDQDLNTFNFPTFSGVNLPNSSTLAQGSFDSGVGGNNGISLNCTVGYELNWQAGHLRNIITGDGSGIPQTIYIDSPIQFPGSGLNYMAVDSSGITFPDGTIQTSAATGGGGLSDSNTYIICKTGDDIAAKYAAAKALTPGGSALSATNRAYLVVMPGVYPLTAQWEIDAEFVDIIGLGSTPLDRGCNVSVTVTDFDINVSANDVRIKGIGTTSDRAFKIDGDKPLQVFEDCSGGDGSFGGFGTASGTFTNCSGGGLSFGGFGTASGSFTNCVGGDSSFGTGLMFPGTASGSFTNCSGGNGSFGGFGTASGTFTNCSGGVVSFGGFGTASGSFTNCVGGDSSFGGSDSFGGGGHTASGTFTNCSGGQSSFGGSGGTASGTFTNCSGGDLSFGGGSGPLGGGTASGTFKDCVGGDGSFGGGGDGVGTAPGTFTNCSGGEFSFGTDTASGTFTNCSGGNYSYSFTYHGTASGTFTNCSGGNYSFGGFGTASGSFTNCSGGESSFGSANGLATGPGTASGTFLRCTLTSGTFQTLSGTGKYRLCIDGNYDVINADAPTTP